MSKAPGWGGGPWALVVELSVLCLWVCFGKSSQIYIYIYIYIYICVWIYGNGVKICAKLFRLKPGASQGSGSPSSFKPRGGNVKEGSSTEGRI